eukprot:TRINITY_DN536_c0_g1_i1.p1 TRINITY_DN536_c0_g1~~TRINITY_DN536_c0_g1_i1.p1  ORF type:complete len:666 (+),score=101.58 TRINITY_DN536_c0_g1_i1:574-2571(+)
MASSLFVLIGNIVFLFLYLEFLQPQTEVVMTVLEIRRKLIAIMAGLGMTILISMSFDKVTHQVYEDVKKTNERIAANTKEKEMFFATMSHEIRNPLQSLLGSIELLEEPKLKKETFRHLLGICKSCSETVLNLISNILDVSKITAEKMQLSPAPADLREIVNKIARVLEPRAEAKGIHLRVQKDPQMPPSLELDPQRISQVILNLVSNAIKFTKKGLILVKLQWFPLIDPEDELSILTDVLSSSSWKECMTFSEKIASQDLSVHLSQYVSSSNSPRGNKKASSVEDQPEETKEVRSSEGAKGIVKIEIMDTGIGIKKENILKLFKPYQQADPAISKDYGGTGLGLWISKNIIMKAQGDIRVKSKEGKGSNFIIAFPTTVCKEVPTFAGANESVINPDLFKDKTCILADSTHENTFVMQQVLSGCGFKVLIANQNCLEALELYKETRKVDVVITDLRVPGMSGQSFILELRKFEKNFNRLRVPIVVVTAEASLEEKSLCLNQYGADQYLVKPIKHAELISALNKAMEAAQKNKIAKKIFIIDDDILPSQFLLQVLEQEGHKCKICNTIEKAKEVFAKEYLEYNLVMLDNLLPDGSGVQFMEFALGFMKEKGAPMPAVISMSGNSVEDQKEMYSGYNLQGYLQKPIRRQVLLELIRIIQKSVFFIIK